MPYCMKVHQKKPKESLITENSRQMSEKRLYQAKLGWVAILDRTRSGQSWTKPVQQKNSWIEPDARVQHREKKKATATAIAVGTGLAVGLDR